MEIELHPTISLLPETNNQLVAPVEVIAEAINNHPELQCTKILFISGNYSSVLSRLSRNITKLDVRFSSPGPGPHLQEMAELADQVFCIYNEPAVARTGGRLRRR